MTTRHLLRAVPGLLLLVPACEGDSGRAEGDGGGGGGIFDSGPPEEDPPPADPGEYLDGIEGEFMAASAEFGVPVSVLKAVAYAETQWMTVEGQEEFDGYAAGFGPMALRGDHLTRGAELLGLDVERVKTGRGDNLRAGAAVLSGYADEGKIDRDDLGAWAPAVARLAGIATEDAAISYVHHSVYGLIKNGLVVTDLAGEVISEIEAEPDVVPDFPAPDGPVFATNPDQPGAVWRGSPNFSARPASESGKVKMVIVHSCEGAYAGCWGWLVNKQSAVSAHYVVKEDGSEISQLVKEKDKGWHIAATYKCSLNGNKECGLEGSGSNNFTVGIEHAGFAKQAAWNANLIDQSAKLVCGITQRNNIPRDKFHVVAHGQLQPYNRIDPGPNWPWATYFEKIAAHCGDGQDPPPDPQDPPPDPQDPPPDPQDPPPDPMNPPADPAEIVVDSNNGNNDAARAKFSASANWTVTAATAGYYGNNYLFAQTAAVADAAEFSFYLENAGTKQVDVWFTAGANRSPDAPVVAFDAQGTKLGSVNVNMQQGGKAWAPVGSFNFKKGWNKVALSRWTTAGYVVIADAVRITGDGGGGSDTGDEPGDPTAEELLALTQNCTQLPGTTKFKPDSGGTATIPICQLAGAVWWRADADIDCDGYPDPRCTVDPYFMPETSSKDSQGQFINAAEVPFLVVPLPSNGFDPKSLGIKTGWSHYGSAGAIIYNGKLIYAPYADAGPTGVIGELSYAAAEKLGIPPSPINGGVASGVTYIVFTGANYVDPIESAAQAETVGKQLATQLLANN
jgi:N-acetyl-anhydromuramyl-L-alanine amidase AmpD